MSAMNPNNRFPTPFGNNSVVVLPTVASQQVSAGWLAFWDSGASPKVCKPMSLYTGSGTAATDRRAIAKIFMGAFEQGLLAAQAANGYPAYAGPGLSVAFDCEYEADCASATFQPGDLVGVISSGAAAVGAISNTGVVAVTALDEAIGRVMHNYPSAVTKVRIKLFGMLSGDDAFKVTKTGISTLPASGVVTAGEVRNALVALGLAR